MNIIAPIQQNEDQHRKGAAQEAEEIMNQIGNRWRGHTVSGLY